MISDETSKDYITTLIHFQNWRTDADGYATQPDAKALTEALRWAIETLKDRATGNQPDEIKVYYMHDNHTFSPLRGTTLDEILAQADGMAKESPGGMLCPPILLKNGQEMRRLQQVAHAPYDLKSVQKWEDGKKAWRLECENDADVMRLLG